MALASLLIPCRKETSALGKCCRSKLSSQQADNQFSPMPSSSLFSTLSLLPHHTWQPMTRPLTAASSLGGRLEKPLLGLSLLTSKMKELNKSTTNIAYLCDYVTVLLFLWHEPNKSVCAFNGKPL